MHDTEFAYDIENHSSDSEDDDDDDEDEDTYVEGDYDGDEETNDEDEDDDDNSDSSGDHVDDASTPIGTEGVASELVQQLVEAGIDLLRERSLENTGHTQLQGSVEALPLAHGNSAFVEDNELGDIEMGSPEYEPPDTIDVADMELATGEAKSLPRYVNSITTFPDDTYHISPALDGLKRDASDLEDSDSSHSRSVKRQKITNDNS